MAQVTSVSVYAQVKKGKKKYSNKTLLLSMMSTLIEKSVKNKYDEKVINKIKCISTYSVVI